MSEPWGNRDQSSNFIRYEDENGYIYYYNSDTDESLWEIEYNEVLYF